MSAKSHVAQPCLALPGQEAGCVLSLRSAIPSSPDPCSLTLPPVFRYLRAYLSMTEASTRQSSTFDPYEQFEVAVPLEKFADCLAEVRTPPRAASAGSCRPPWALHAAQQCVAPADVPARRPS